MGDVSKRSCETSRQDGHLDSRCEDHGDCARHRADHPHGCVGRGPTIRRDASDHDDVGDRSEVSNGVDRLVERPVQNQQVHGPWVAADVCYVEERHRQQTRGGRRKLVDERGVDGSQPHRPLPGTPTQRTWWAFDRNDDRTDAGRAQQPWDDIGRNGRPADSETQRRRSPPKRDVRVVGDRQLLDRGHRDHAGWNGLEPVGVGTPRQERFGTSLLAGCQRHRTPSGPRTKLSEIDTERHLSAGRSTYFEPGTPTREVARCDRRIEATHGPTPSGYGNPSGADKFGSTYVRRAASVTAWPQIGAIAAAGKTKSTPPLGATPRRSKSSVTAST